MCRSRITGVRNKRSAQRKKSVVRLLHFGEVPGVMNL